MRIFRDLELVEQLGSGIPRILEHYGRESFSFSENFLRMTLIAKEGTVDNGSQIGGQVSGQIGGQIDKAADGTIDKINVRKHPSKYIFPNPGHRHTFVANRYGL